MMFMVHQCLQGSEAGHDTLESFYSLLVESFQFLFDGTVKKAVKGPAGSEFEISVITD